MAKRKFQPRHRFVRNSIREDILYFALPAVLVYTVGLVVSVKDGWDGLFVTLWALIRQPGSISELSAQNIVGLALIVSGFTILLSAHITLGRFYSSTLVIRKEHQLITHGVYHYTRHPIYLGSLMVCIGLPVYASSLSGLLSMSVLIPILLYRIRLEERMLTAEFGDAYRAYQQTTRKLVPFIY